VNLLLSVHDVTPFHAERLGRIESFLASRSIARVTYLLVPDFHGRFDAASDPEFVRWCRRPRPYEVEWAQHGHLHLEEAPPAAIRVGLVDRLRRRWMTAGEGEFLALRGEALRERLEVGRRICLGCLGHAPHLFVAPAWLFNEELIPALAGAGFAYTEDHRAVIDVRNARRVAAPVVTWATRTRVRRVGSRAVAPILSRRWSGEPLLRVAIHPYDFDHPDTVRSIDAVLRSTLAAREPITCSQLRRLPGPLS